MPVISPKIFKAYDIRGVYPKDLNQKTAELIGRALVRFLRRGKKALEERIDIAVGRDNRSSSPTLFAGLKRGILLEGGNVVEIGLSPSPLLYFSVWRHHFEAGVQITASHNPPQDNGFKIIDKNNEIIGVESGLVEIKKLAEKIALEKRKGQFSPRGEWKKEDFLGEYISFNLKEIKNMAKLAGLYLVIDTGNAVAGLFVKELKKVLPCRIKHLFAKLDGSFPHHNPNPLEKENIKYLEREVKKQKADLGVAFDGDGDRIMFVDENGEAIPPDYITSLMAKIVLREEKAKFVYNICSSNIIRDVVLENGGVPILWKIGHTFMKKKSKEENAIFGGEYSGHYLLRSHHFCEAPLYVLFKILEEMALTKKPISKLIRPFKRYFYSGIVNFEVKDKEKKIKEIEKAFPGGKKCQIDGLRLDFKDFWFNVRPSNTENLLRVVVEAKRRDLMEKKLNEIKRIISS